MTILELMEEGGSVMYPLAFFLFLILLTMIERVWFHRYIQKRLEQMAKKAGPDKNEELVKDKLLGGIFGALYDDSKSKNQQIWEQKMARQLRNVNSLPKKNLWILATIASSAPFVGLFGTVVGIIKSFDRIRQSGKSGFAVVSGDISEALIATAAGILVAVVALLVYNFFQSRIGGIQLKLRDKIEEMMEMVSLKEKSAE